MAFHPTGLEESGLRLAVAAWAGVSLSARRGELDQQALALVDAQEQSAAGREALKAAVRDFKAVPAAERAAQVSPVIKSFQAEVDALSRRAAFAEAAFFALYHALEAAPDPAPLLAAAAESAGRLAKLEVEAADALSELGEFRKEALQMKNQDVTVRLLQVQLREAEDAREALVAAELAKRSAAAEAERAAAEAAAAEREREAVASETAARAELRALSAERDEAHERLFRLREESAARAHAQGEQLELLSAELARADADRAALQAQLREAGRSPAAGAAGACGAAAASAAAAAEVAHVRAARAEADAARERRAAAEALAGELAAKEAALQLAGRQAAEAKFEARAARDEAGVLRARLAALKAARDGAAHSPAEHALLAAARPEVQAARGVEREETERQLARARADAADAQRALASERERCASLEGHLAAARVAVGSLEGRLLGSLQQQPQQPQTGGAASTLEQLLRAGGAAEQTAGSAGPTAAAAGQQPPRTPQPASPAQGGGEGGLAVGVAGSTPADASYLDVLVAQRNRLRAEAAERSAEASRARALLHGAQLRSEQLAADNLRLFERLRYLEDRSEGHSASAGAHARAAQAGSGGEAVGRYRVLYEESLSPFAAFSKRERMHRYQELNGAEKLMLSMASLVLASKRARMGLAVYVLCLHGLTMLTLYAVSHVRTCDRTRAASLALTGAVSM